MSRFFLIHDWNGSPEHAWFPWLRRELSADGHRVIAPLMPDPAHPDRDLWREMLRLTVGRTDRETFFIAHGMGAQAAARYVQDLHPDMPVGGMVFVAPWTRLKPAAMPTAREAAIAMPWISDPIHWEAIAGRSRTFIAVYSSDDPFVYLEDAKLLQNGLQAEIIIEHGLRHMDAVSELQSVLVACRAMAAS